MTEFFEYLQEEYFEDLYDLETNSAEYCSVQGELITEIAGVGLEGGDYRISQNDALHVATYLNNGEVDSAEEELEQLLEE